MHIASNTGMRLHLVYKDMFAVFSLQILMTRKKVALYQQLTNNFSTGGDVEADVKMDEAGLSISGSAFERDFKMDEATQEKMQVLDAMHADDAVPM